MATKTYFINSTQAAYTDEEFAWMQSLFLTEGLIGDEDGNMGMQVTQLGTPGLGVQVSAGKALIEITKSTRTFKVVMESDAVTQLVIAPNSSGSNRVDAVIVRVDVDAEPNVTKSNIGSIEIVQGDGASALDDAEITTAVGSDGWYRLANVTVADSTLSILNANITDLRAKAAFLDGLGVSSLLSALVGVVFPYAGLSAPTGFLLCNGQAVNRLTYPALFAAIGTTYGAGDGSTTFNVPDLRGRFPLGYAASAPTKVFTFASRSSNTLTVTSDVLTNSTTNEIQTGQKVRYTTTGTPIGGLTNDTDYYLIRVAYNQFQLATSVENANYSSPSVITLSSDGTGVHTFTLTYSARALGDKGGQEVLSSVPRHNHAITGVYEAGGSGSGGTSGGQEQQITASPAGENAPSSMPLFTVLNYIIRAS